MVDEQRQVATFAHSTSPPKPGVRSFTLEAKWHSQWVACVAPLAVVIAPPNLWTWTASQGSVAFSAVMSDQAQMPQRPQLVASSTVVEQGMFGNTYQATHTSHARHHASASCRSQDSWRRGLV